nr:nodulin-26-like [Ipomoea batatas]
MRLEAYASPQITKCLKARLRLLKQLKSQLQGFISAFQKAKDCSRAGGTYIFIFVGCGSAIVDREKELTMVGIALAWGLPLMALIYTLGHVSGAHFNPCC